MSTKRENVRGEKNNKELFIIIFAARVIALLAGSLNVQAAVARANHTQEKKAFFIYLSRDKRLLVSKPKLVIIQLCFLQNLCTVGELFAT